MTPVERLQAAIDKLEAMRTASEPIREDSKWAVMPVVVATSRRSNVLDFCNAVYDGSTVAESKRTACAELIVTLHRTIDAQLAILRATVANLDENRWMVVEPAEEVVALADAILGGDS